MSCQLYPERSAGGGGGVSGELGDLSNVTISSVQNGQIISYNSTLGIWVNTANAGGGGGGGAQTGDNVSIFVNDTGYVTLNDLGSAATTDSTAYATSAQGLLADSAVQPSDNISVLTNDTGFVTLGDLGSAATTDSTDYATSAQGSLADSAVQPSDNISVLTNDTGFVTLGDLGSAATTDSTAYATSAQGLLADSALQSGDLNPVYYASTGAFPSAGGSNHGAIAHSHSDGAMYFAHNSVWNKLANYSDLSSAGGNVTSVAGKTGVVTLDSTDISGLGTAATTDSGDYATSAQGSLADSAVQSGDNISLLSNDAGYITEAGEAPVQSVAGRTGHVTLDYTDIVGLGDVVTTSSGDYATSAEGSLAVTALQSGDNVSSLTNDAGYLTGVATGTAAAFDVGTSANNIVQLDGSAKLPAVDGSQLTGVTVDVETPLTTALRGTDNPHMGAHPNQSLKVVDNPYNSVMMIADEEGILKIVNDAGVNNVAVGFSVLEDPTEPDIEVVSNNETFSVINGDSDSKGVNGLPIRQGFNVRDIGANPAPLLISGGTIS